MKTVQVIIERAKDGSYSVYTKAEDLPYGLNGNGETLKEAKADFLQGYEAIQKVYEENGEAFEEANFEYVYDTPSFLREYAYAFTLAGLERITGVNQKQLGHYISGYRHPSEATKRKIEHSMQEFSKNLLAVRLYI